MNFSKYTIKDIANNLNKRKIILFGAGDIAQKTHRITKDFQVSFIIDNAENLWNTADDTISLDIKDPSIIKKKYNKYFIIICTTSYREVANQLIDYNYELDKDFIVSPILNDLRTIDEIEQLEQKLIFSSGAPSVSNKYYGGGIYLLELKKFKWSYSKKIYGNCYGIIKYKSNYISVDQSIGIFEFDKNFKITRSKKLPSFSRPHGVAYSSKYEEFYVCCSYKDEILILDKNFNKKKIISISDKFKNLKVPSHHINDCEVHEDYLYVSMFSESGNWKLDVYDGCILQIDLKKKTIDKAIVRNLWMPHNPKIFNGNFYVNDSLRGNLLGNNFNIVSNFKSFTRGLANDGSYFYIGQSKNRNFSRNIGITNNTSIDSGIVILDEKSKVSRFLQLSPYLSEIHSIEIYN